MKRNKSGPALPPLPPSLPSICINCIRVIYRNCRCWSINGSLEAWPRIVVCGVRKTTENNKHRQIVVRRWIIETAGFFIIVDPVDGFSDKAFCFHLSVIWQTYGHIYQGERCFLLSHILCCLYWLVVTLRNVVGWMDAGSELRSTPIQKWIPCRRIRWAMIQRTFRVLDVRWCGVLC